MAFTVKDWVDGSGGGTPLSAAALEDMETRLAAYADSLRSGMPRPYAYKVGRYYHPPVVPGTQSTQAFGLGTASVYPTFYTPGGITYDQIYAEVTGAATAGGRLRLGAWNVGSDGVPTTVALDAGSVDSTTVAVKTQTISWTPAAGVYALGAVCQVANCTVRVMRQPLLIGTVATFAGDAAGAIRSLIQPTTDVALVSFTTTVSDDRYSPLVGLRIGAIA
jgi:hypothetical protein